MGETGETHDTPWRLQIANCTCLRTISMSLSKVRTLSWRPESDKRLTPSVKSSSYFTFIYRVTSSPNLLQAVGSKLSKLVLAFERLTTEE